LAEPENGTASLFCYDALSDSRVMGSSRSCPQLPLVYQPATDYHGEGESAQLVPRCRRRKRGSR
jgi:hypothetical protein